MLRFMSLLVVVGVVGGCVTTGSHTAGGDAPVAKLQAENKSIVIVHTSMHDHCQSLMATLARPNEAGQFEAGRTVVLKHPLAFSKAPSTFEVPAGEYGFIRFECQTGTSRSRYSARVAKQGSVFNGPRTTYVPIAKFTVQPGEVVDIGSLRLPTRQLGEFSVFQFPKREFVPIITPIPDEWLKKLAETEPGLYQTRTVRPMTGAIRI
jgi:hypothetical protein